MLSRTAENLYWLSRYMERAECTSRLISMGQRMAMVPGASHSEEWASILKATASWRPEDEGQEITQDTIVERLVLDPENPSSLHACILQARNNGKAVRTALTQDMWESLNEGWRYFEGRTPKSVNGSLSDILEWVRHRVGMFKGAVETAMLRNDGYEFLRLGGFVERADMTLRLLNVKYFVLLPERDVIGGGRDHHQWTSILRAVSGLRAYHHVYRSDYAPWKIADFLILNCDFPRSVNHCYQQIRYSLDRLEQRYGQHQKCHKQARAEHDRLSARKMDDVFQDGLHEFIDTQIQKTASLSDEISKAYYFASH